MAISPLDLAFNADIKDHFAYHIRTLPFDWRGLGFTGDKEVHWTEQDLRLHTYSKLYYKM